MSVLIESKFDSSCKACKGKVRRGARVLWTPGQKGVVHQKCPESDVYAAPIKIDAKLQLGDLTKVPGFETLYDHQTEAVNAVKNGHNRLYLGWEPGLGKSLGSLVSAEIDRAYPLVIVCPAVVKINWQREVKNWLGREAQILSGRKPGEITEDIVIINYDVLPSWESTLIALNPQGLILDEVHYAKNGDSKRTKAARKIAESMDSDALVFGLSGTPTPNSVYDLVMPLVILDKIKDFGGQRKYINRYCPPFHTAYGVSYSRPRHLDELHDNLKNSCFIRRTKEECLDLPEKIVVDIPVDVKVEDTNEFYRPFLDAMRKVTITEAKRIAAEIPQDSKKGQIMAERSAAGEAKVNSIAELALDTDGPLIVFVHHKEVQRQVFEKIKKKRSATLLSGGMTPRKRQQAIDDFQNGDVDVIVCSITAAGIGINLQRAESVILGELPLTYAETDQAISRAHRSGQRNVLTVSRVIALGTSDEILVNLINKKEAVSAKVEDGREIEVVSANDIIAQRLLDLKREVC